MIVKQDSIIEFFNDNVVGSKIDLRDPCRADYRYFFNEEILVKWLECPTQNKTVIFEIEEISNQTGQKLKTTITYQFTPYDDVCSKLLKKSTKTIQA